MIVIHWQTDETDFHGNLSMSSEHLEIPHHIVHIEKLVMIIERSLIAKYTFKNPVMFIKRSSVAHYTLRSPDYAHLGISH
jgi:hypothetical protein